MTSRAEELAKMLGEFRPSRVANSYSYPYASSSDSYSWSGIALNLSIVAFVVFLLLVIVHYTITPIFTFTIGQKGLFPLANTNDGQLVWTQGPVVADLSANVQRILPTGFTIQQDIFVQEDNAPTIRPRVFFYRSTTPVVPGSGNTDVSTQYPNSNLIMYLLPDTNDLVVSGITQKDNNTYIESAPTILNVPVRQPFRLTVVLLPQVLEVYLNGQLFGTKTFRYPPKEITNSFFGPPDAFRSSVRTMNFQYWDRPLSAMEIKNAGPALPDASKFGMVRPANEVCAR